MQLEKLSRERLAHRYEVRRVRKDRGTIDFGGKGGLRGVGSGNICKVEGHGWEWEPRRASRASFLHLAEVEINKKPDFEGAEYASVSSSA